MYQPLLRLFQPPKILYITMIKQNMKLQQAAAIKCDFCLYFFICCCCLILSNEPAVILIQSSDGSEWYYYSCLMQ